MNVLRPTDQRTLTWTESETENAWWLTQLEVDPGRYLNPLLKCPQNTCCILQLGSEGRHLDQNILNHSVGIVAF